MGNPARQTRSSSKRVCVIGAGVTGIAVIHELNRQGILYDCYEQSNDIGGIWHYNDNPNSSSVYQNCTLNHSTHLMAYPFFSMNGQNERFIGRQEYHQYLTDTVDTLQLRQTINLNTKVTSVTPFGDLWRVVVNETTHLYSNIVICTGYYSERFVPDEFTKNYHGDAIHSSQYREPTAMANKKVLIVGSGSSAFQIACDIANITTSVALSVRNMPYVIPKYIFGRPYNRSHFSWLKKLPVRWQSTVIEYLINCSNGKQQHYGLPAPCQDLLSGRLPISSDIFDKTESGQIQFLPGIDYCNQRQIIFNNGAIHDFDTVIFATGYQRTLPFLHDVPFDHADHYKFISHIDRPGLFYCGFLQPIGPVPPVVATQARFIANIISGQDQKPDQAAQRHFMEQLLSTLSKRYHGDFSGRIAVSDYLSLF